MKHPELSILCYFDDRHEQIEQTLSSIYDLSTTPFELIICTDTSSSAVRETIRSVIEHAGHEQSYFFDFSETRGRGAVLNLALEEVRGNYLWIVDRLEAIHEEQLNRFLSDLKASTAITGFISGHGFPGGPHDWLELWNRDRLPADQQFLWKWTSLPQSEKFISPYWRHFHAVEMALRVLDESLVLTGDSFFESGESGGPALDDRTRFEFLLSLQRIPDLAPALREEISRKIRSDDIQPVHISGTPDPDKLLAEAVELQKKGENIASLEKINHILLANPDHEDARRLKVSVLKKMRRYVEAAEQKQVLDRSTGKTRQASGLSRSDTQPEDAAESSNTDVESDGTSAELPDTAPAPQDTTSDQPDTTTERPESGKTEQTGEQHAPGTEPSSSGHTEPAVNTQDPGEHWLPQAPSGPGGGEPSGGAGRPEEDEEDAKTQPPYRREPTLQSPVTIVIPTASDRKELLEKTLIALDRHVDAAHVDQLIIIDNASLDDTHEYLQQLKEDGFWNLRVLVNSANAGFAASINQALDIAETDMVCILHNDTLPDSNIVAALGERLERHPNVMAVGPMTDHSLNPLQVAAANPEETVSTDEAPASETPVDSESASPAKAPDKAGDPSTPPVPSPEKEDASKNGIREVEYIDSFCMMIHNTDNLRFDENYGPAFFDDVDFCFQIHKLGGKVALAEDVHVPHQQGITTGDIGLSVQNKRYWKNLAYFNRKWELTPRISQELKQQDELDQITWIGEHINIYYPEQELLEYVESHFTSELKTRIMETREFEPERLIALLRLMIAANRRDVLRHLEQQLSRYEPDPELYYHLVTFYYDNNIYSRCQRYIDELDQDSLPFVFRLYRLKIAMGEKKLEQAAELLDELMQESPSHPDLLGIAGDLHQIFGNKEEAKEFRELAKQVNPFRNLQSQKA